MQYTRVWPPLVSLAGIVALSLACTAVAGVPASAPTPPLGADTAAPRLNRITDLDPPPGGKIRTHRRSQPNAQAAATPVAG